MRRTSRRPLVARTGPDGQATIKPGEALASGIVLGAAATLLLGLLANWLAAALADGAILFYVFVYTLGLKRRTASNIVIGGAAGCFPVLVGWAAVTGRVSLPAVRAVRRHLLLDPAALLGAGHEVPRRLRRGQRADAAGGGLARRWWRARSSSTPTRWSPPRWPWSRTRAGSTACCAVGLGAWFLVEAHQLRGRMPHRTRGSCRINGGASRPPPMRLFHLSIAYLTLLFAAVAVTALLPWGRW